MKTWILGAAIAALVSGVGGGALLAHSRSKSVHPQAGACCHRAEWARSSCCSGRHTRQDHARACRSGHAPGRCANCTRHKGSQSGRARGGCCW
jgi:hypothetical protein